MPRLGLSFLSLGGVFASLVFFIVGCAEVTEGPETVQFDVVIQDWFEGTPVENLEMCETDTANCATTDAGGNVTLELPANEEVSWTFTKDGYASIVSWDVTDASFDATRGLWTFSDERLAEEFKRLGTPYPPETQARSSSGWPPILMAQRSAP